MGFSNFQSHTTMVQGQSIIKWEVSKFKIFKKKVFWEFKISLATLYTYYFKCWAFKFCNYQLLNLLKTRLKNWNSFKVDKKNTLSAQWLPKWLVSYWMKSSLQTPFKTILGGYNFISVYHKSFSLSNYLFPIFVNLLKI